MKIKCNPATKEHINRILNKFSVRFSQHVFSLQNLAQTVL